MDRDIYGRMREIVLRAIPGSISLADEIRDKIVVGPPRDRVRSRRDTGSE